MHISVVLLPFPPSIVFFKTYFSDNRLVLGMQMSTGSMSLFKTMSAVNLIRSQPSPHLLLFFCDINILATFVFQNLWLSYLGIVFEFVCESFPVRLLATHIFFTLPKLRIFVDASGGSSLSMCLTPLTLQQRISSKNRLPRMSSKNGMLLWRCKSEACPWRYSRRDDAEVILEGLIGLIFFQWW